MNASILFLIAWLAPQAAARAQTQAQPPVPAGSPPAQTATHAAGDYVVGSQDVLAISVTAGSVPVGDLTKEVTVDQDGTFDYPMLGRIQAAGKGVRQIESEIASQLLSKGFFSVAPSVNVDVRAYRSQSVWVMGAVRNTGAQTIAGNASVMSVLGAAGFTTDSGSYITLTHKPKNATTAGPVSLDDPNAEKIRISIKDLESGRAQNIPLRDGDTIFVSAAEHYLIQGNVHSPGQYSLEDGLTVVQALARAGGVTDQAAKNRIDIIRTVNGKQVRIRVKKDQSDLVQPNDTIDVPRRFM